MTAGVAPVTETVVPAAADPAAAPTPETVQETTEKPVPARESIGPLTQADARKQMYARRSEQAKAAVQARPAEKAADPAIPVPEATTGAASATPEPPAAEAKVEPAKVESAPSFIAVPIQKGHPVHGMNGVESIEVRTEAQARAVQALANGTYARLRDLQKVTKDRDEWRDKAIRFESSQVALERWEGSPEAKVAKDEYLAMHELEEAGSLPPGTAARHWEGAKLQFRGLADKVREEKVQEIVGADEQQAVEAFRQDAWQQTQGLPPHVRQLPDFEKWFISADAAFRAECESGAYDETIGRIEDPAQRADALHQKFKEALSARLLREPAVRSVMAQFDQQGLAAKKAAADQVAAQQRDKEAIEKAAVERHMKLLANQRKGVAPPNPLGSLPAGSRDRLPGQQDGQVIDPATQTAHEVRKSAAANARQRAAGRFGNR